MAKKSKLQQWVAEIANQPPLIHAPPQYRHLFDKANAEFLEKLTANAGLYGKLARQGLRFTLPKMTRH